MEMFLMEISEIISLMVKLRLNLQMEMNIKEMLSKEK
jgi:hypothetical protein